MKKIPYGKHSITNEDINAVVSVLESDYLTQGPQIAEFEKVIAEYHGAKYAVAFSNGTAALHASYYAIGVNIGDEIITSPITFAATANAAIYCGGKPVFADIDLSTNCIDKEEILKKINNKTKVISPVALAGYPVDLKQIRHIADDKKCKVLYDAAHAIGSKRDASFGMEYLDVAILSFHPVKHITTGEGGMALTNDEDIYKKLLLFRTHGIIKEKDLLMRNDGPWYYEMIDLGFNYRMSDIQSALGISQFKRINKNLYDRNSVAKFYTDELGNNEVYILPPNVGFDILDHSNLDDVKDIHSYHLFNLRVKDKKYRKKLYDFLRENGILAQIHYIPVYFMPYYKESFGYSEGLCPNAEEYYYSEISIPMYHNMKQEDTEYVIQKLKEFCKKI